MAATLPPPVRPRSRAHAGSNSVTDEMRALAVIAYRANKAKNAEAVKEKDARKKLNAAMEQTGATAFEVAVADDKVIDVAIEPGEANLIDVVALHKLVDAKTFLKIVSATQKAVEELAGTNVMMKCLKSVPTAPALKIKER